MALIVVFALLCALSIDQGQVGSPATEPVLTLACMVIFHTALVRFAFKIARKATLAIENDWEGRTEHLQRFAKGRRIHFGLWITVNLCALYMLSWPDLIHVNCHLGRFILIDDLLVMAPMFASWFASSAFFYDVHRALHDRTTERAFSTRLNFTWSQARVFLGIGFVPLMLVSTTHQCLQWINPGWLESRYAWTLYAAPLAGVLMFFPLVLRHVWPTRRLSDGPLRSRLERLANSSSVQINDILVWDTQGRIMNAAVAGVLPWLRFVFLTDRLLEALSDEEIEATFAHEIGHVNYWHLIMRTLAMFMPLSLCVFAEHLAPQTVSDTLTATRILYSPLVLVGLSLTYMFFVFGWYTRQLEHQADLFACQYLASKRDLPYAQQQYIQLIRKLTPQRERMRRGWLHPDFSDRIAFIDCVVPDPQKSHSFEWRVRIASLLLVGSAATPLLMMWWRS